MLATALANDAEVRQAFSDGIYWLTIGQRPNLLELQNQLLRHLAAPQQPLTTQKDAKDALRERLEGRRILVVLDDIWTVDEADPFSIDAPPARLLVTTRNQEVLAGLSAEEHRLGLLSPEEALAMLASWAGAKDAHAHRRQAAEVARECGRLPLALAMVGARIRRSNQPAAVAWQDALDCLLATDLEEIKRAFAGYPYPDLLRAIEVSVEALDGPDRERYLDLAVFREDQPIPETALSVLWKLESRRTRSCMDRLAERSLATVGVESSAAGNHSTLNVHDLQSDFIRKRRETKLPGLHLRLVEAWDALPKPPDIYAWRWVAYHLVKAGRLEDLRRLLLDFNYLQAKLAATDPNTLIDDYDYFAHDEGLRLIQSAIRLSTNVLSSDPYQFAGQLKGRLIGIGNLEIATFLKQAAVKPPLPWFQPIQANLTPPDGPLIRTLQGHRNLVSGVAVTPEGDRAVSASHDWTLRVWNLRTGQSLLTLQGHNNLVSAVAVTPDGGRAVSASWDQTLRIWDLRTGQSLLTLQGHRGAVTGVTVTPNGRRAVSASDDQTLRVWSLGTGQSMRAVQDHSDGVLEVAVTPNGRRAVSASWDQTLRVWNLGTGQNLLTLQGHRGAVVGVAVTPDGRRAVSASWDQTLRVWNLGTGQSLFTLQGHRGAVRGVAVAPDGRRAVSASDDQTLRVWDLGTGQSLFTLQGHRGAVAGVAVTPDGRRAVSASHDWTLRVWDLSTGQSPLTLQGHRNLVSGVTIAPDGRRAISASNDRTLRLWDLGTGHSLFTLQGHRGAVSAVAVTPDGRRAVSASDDQTLRLWDLGTGQSLFTLQGHRGAVTGVAVAPDGRRAVSASDDQTLRLWNLMSGEEILCFTGDSKILDCAIAPNGRLVVAGDSLRWVHLLKITEAETTHPAITDEKIQLLQHSEQAPPTMNS